MADTTISGLSQGTPSKDTAIIPFSDGSTTYRTSPSGIVAASPGCLLQVKQAVRTSIFTHSSGQVWLDIPNVSVDITPTSLNSKFLLNWCGYVSTSVGFGSWSAIALKIVKVISGATSDVIVGDSRGSTVRASCGGFCIDNRASLAMSGTYLDSPSIPNPIVPITYKMQLFTESSNYPCVIGGSYNTSFTYSNSTPTYLTVQEIAG